MSPTNGNSARSATPETKPATEDGSRKPRPRLLRAIRRASVGFVLVVVALGIYLYFHARAQQAEFVSRNFRALASISTQVGAKLQSVDNVLKSADEILNKNSADAAAPFIPAYRDLTLWIAPHDTFVGNRAEPCVRALTDTLRLGAEWRSSQASPAPCLSRRFEVTAAKRSKSAARTAKTGFAALSIATYLDTDLEPRVFDKTLVADSSGRVLLEVGLPDVALNRLDIVVKGSLPDSSESWNQVRLKHSMSDVKFAGKTYRLFLEPCCLTGDGGRWDRQLVVAGLVNKEAFVRSSLKISLSWLAVIFALLALAVVAYPFLKLWLLRPRQAVTLSDGVFLGVAALLGCGLTTIFLLDIYAYGKSRYERDTELHSLAGEISTNLTTELQSAHRQLSSMSGSAQVDSALRAGGECLRRIRKDSLEFPFFESWARLTAGGMQACKWSTDRFVQPRVDVKDRDYFRMVKAERAWPASWHPDGGQFYLESTLSRTTGKRQAVLSIPTADKWTPVATMALEMLSLIGVVLPPGYGFAVVDDSARTLFHSDPKRNLDERFLSESGGNRELRAALVSRTADTLNLKYGGFDHRAFVTPLSGLPWSLITFMEKEPGRITNAESLATSIYLLLIYVLVLVIFGVVTVMGVPGYRAPWLWPDRRRLVEYRVMSLANGLLLAAFVVAFAALEQDDLLAVGFILPLLAIAAGWAGLAAPSRSRWPVVAARVIAVSLLVALGRALLDTPTAAGPHAAAYALAVAGALLAIWPRKLRRNGTAHPITRTYLVAAVFFILLIGVLPAAAFFKVARKAHTEMLVKGVQLHLARRIEQRADSIHQAYSDSLGAGKAAAASKRLCIRQREGALCELDLYYRFFHGTKRAAKSAAGVASAEPRSELVNFLMVPYRPKASVEWRGLLPSRAEDGAWWWTHNGNELRFEGAPLPGREPVALSSIVPGLRPQSANQRVTLFLLSAVVLLVVWLVAAFVTRRFFLIDVTDPVIVSRDRTIASVGGTNLLVVCRNGEEEDKISAGRNSAPFDLSDISDRRLARTAQSVAKEAGERTTVVLKHFEHLRHDRDETEAKLKLLDGLVNEYGYSVVVISGQESDGSAMGLREVWRLAMASPKHAGDSRIEALESLVPVDAGRWLGLKSCDDERRWTATGPHRPASKAREIIDEEGRCDRHLQRIWGELADALEQYPPSRAEPNREELLDLLSERALPYYQAIWESCHPDERIVLTHLASYGLVNEKDRRVLRRLLTRGLIRREPHFVVMNETFRRYLAGRASECEAAMPVEPGAWESVQRPLVIVGTAVVVVLFVTQQELFGAATAVIGALTTGVASLSKISGLFDKRGTGGGAG